MGETVVNFEYDDEGNLIETNSAGAWETGVDGALPGCIMKTNPLVGDHYFQEFLVGEAEDHAMVLGLGETHTVPFGTFSDVLHTRDFTLSFETYGDTFFAPSVGTIMELDFDTATGVLLGTKTLRSISVVPEPNALALVLCGAIGLAFRKRK